MENNLKEYGILLIKPDGVKKIINEVHEMIIKYNLEIVKSKKYF